MSQNINVRKVSANSPIAILVDGHSLAFRSYYAFAKSRSGGLKTSTGIPTSVCFGFLKSLLEVMETQKPEYLAIAFDLGVPTFRHEADKTYKADRAETPEDLIVDVKNLQDILAAFNLPVVTVPGYEADDILGTLAQQGSAAGFRVKILSGDQDLFQLIDTEKGISVLHLAAGKGSTPSEFGPAEVKEKLGILPNQVVDYKALCGDTSDNIPGVKGIGKKTAVKLLSEYGSLIEIYASLEQIKGANQKKLEVGKAEADHSHFMAKIELNVPLDIEIEDCQIKGFSRSAIEPVLQKLELQHFLNQIPHLEQQFSGLAGVKSSEVEPQEQQQKIWGDTPDARLDEQSIDTEEDDWFFTVEDTKAAQQQIPTKSEVKVQIIDTEDKLKELVNLLKEQQNHERPVAWDTETTSLEPRDAELVGIGCCWGKNLEEVAYIPTGHKARNNLDKVTVLEALKPILEGANYPKVLQNAKFDRLIFRCQGIKLAGVVFDTMLASYVLNPGTKHSLEEICIRYLTNAGIKLQSYHDLVAKNQTIADVDILKVANYCGTQVLVTFQLVEKLRAELEKADQNKPTDKSLLKLLVDVEQPLESVLAEMEYLGIRIDIEYLRKFSIQLKKDLEVIETRAYQTVDINLLHEYLKRELEKIEPDLLTNQQELKKAISSSILKAYITKLPKEKRQDLETMEKAVNQAETSDFLNLNSPSQLSELLFDILSQNRKKSRKIKTGYSTDVVVLERLQEETQHHPIIDEILNHRTLYKLFSTYIEAIPRLVRTDTQRVHTNFNQTQTDTGRLSSSDPNLQNIPIGTEFSRQIRKAFLPEEGWLLVAADYSQIELRILAHLSQEPILIEAYQNNQDVHTVTAKLLFEKDKITSDERRVGKTINFGVIYGMGAQKLARSVKISVKESKLFLDKYKQQYSQVFQYLENLKKAAIAQGYVETILGRRRYFEFESKTLRDLKGKKPEEINLDEFKRLSQNDAQLLRAAANSPIQGSSADIIKIAMVKLHEILPNYQARLLLQVHDELVFEVPPNEWEKLQQVIKSTMENAVELTVPLIVDIHAGQNWMETK